jgi:large subunit ribosomal protein L17
MMRNMVTSILEHGQVTCTLARAKEVRQPLEKMITLGKRGDLHSRRMALRFVKSKLAMSQLFGELAERYQEREGGYCRIIRLAPRRLGDASEMAIVQLVGSEKDVLTEVNDELKKSRSSKPKAAKKESVLKDVSAQLKDQPEAAPAANDADAPASEAKAEEKADAKSE